eukprot:5195141-Pyramimonas_sp.AAC.1
MFACACTFASISAACVAANADIQRAYLRCPFLRLVCGSRYGRTCAPRQHQTLKSLLYYTRLLWYAAPPLHLILLKTVSFHTIDTETDTWLVMCRNTL